MSSKVIYISQITHTVIYVLPFVEEIRIAFDLIISQNLKRGSRINVEVMMFASFIHIIIYLVYKTWILLN